MKEELIEKIKSRGYWRVNFQPVALRERLDSLKDAREIVEKNQVKLLGWYYPHTVIDKDDQSGKDLNPDYFQAWMDVGEHKEFWRMYKSGQFLAYKAFREDWFLEPSGLWAIPFKIEPNTKFGVFICIYEFTQIYEFLSRLCIVGLYDEGVKVNISLWNLQNRSLWIEERGRMPFSFDRTSTTEKIELTKEYSKEQIIGNAAQLANERILKVFELFDWNPTKEQILVDQNKLLSGHL